LTTEAIVLTPLFIALGLTIGQFILIHTANFRVNAAAVEGARLASQGESIDVVHAGVRAVLGNKLNQYVKTEVEYHDVDEDNGSPPIEMNDDNVIVSVTIPMERAGKNYLGFLGGHVVDLHLRAVVEKPMEVDISSIP